MKRTNFKISRRLLLPPVLLIAFVLSCTPGCAQILSGSITNYEESSPSPALTFGDGTHSVSLWWSVHNVNSSGYFYASGDTQVAVAANVSSVGEITDASVYSFTTGAADSYYVGPVSDVGVTGGLGSFIVLRNQQNGFYGVVRIDDIFKYAVPINHGTYSSYSGLNATWWFQSNGSGDFSPVPEPSIYAFGLLTLGTLLVSIRYGDAAFKLTPTAPGVYDRFELYNNY